MTVTDALPRGRILVNSMRKSAMIGPNSVYQHEDSLDAIESAASTADATVAARARQNGFELATADGTFGGADAGTGHRVSPGAFGDHCWACAVRDPVSCFSPRLGQTNLARSPSDSSPECITSEPTAHTNTNASKFSTGPRNTRHQPQHRRTSPRADPRHHTRLSAQKPPTALPEEGEV